MFSKFKDKLKGALSVFSSKTEEEAEVKEEVVEVSQEWVKEKSKKKATKKEKKKEENKKKEEKSKKKKEVKKKAPKKNPKKKEEKVEEEKVEEEPEKVIVEEKKKGFFSRLFSKKEEEVPKEEVGQVIGDAKKKKEKVLQEPEAEREAEEEEAQRSETFSASKAKFSAEPEEEKKSFFGRIKQTITTKTISEEKFNELFWDLELILLENNVSLEVIEKIKEDLKEELVDKPLPRNVPAKIQETLQKTLKDILSFEKIDIVKKVKDKKPFIIAFFGINGAGKTTSIAKLTHYLKENNLSVVLAACDTFRAAAIQQLREHADKLGVKMIKHDYGSDAAAVAFDAIKHAEKENVDVVLIDTAGRLHSNTNLMAELEKIIRVTKPDLKIFVGESITGNDCIEQARKFNELVEMDGVILTKADVDEKGGAPLSISYTIKKPILFLGVGQGYNDLEEFDAGVVLERLGF